VAICEIGLSALFTQYIVTITQVQKSVFNFNLESVTDFSTEEKASGVKGLDLEPYFLHPGVEVGVPSNNEDSTSQFTKNCANNP